MALEGNLKDFGLPDIFQLISIQQKTGVLELVAPNEKASIRFQNGDIVHVASSNFGSMTSLLQHYLVINEKISRQDARRIEETAKSSNMRFEKALVTGRHLSSDELQDAVLHIMEETIYDLFTWQEASYSFSAGKTSYIPSFPAVAIRSDGLLMEGMRRIDEWPQIIKLIPDLNIVFDKNPEEKININDFPPDEARVYLSCDGQTLVKKIVGASAVGRYRTYESLTNLIRANLIIKVEKTRSKSAPKREWEIKKYVIAAIHYLFTFIFPVIILILILIARLIYLNIAETTAPTGNPTVKIADEHNQSQLRQTLTMYYLIHNRFPEFLNELELEGIATPDAVKRYEKKWVYQAKQNGSQYELKVKKAE
ncbi:MAG: hypothetical protein B6244_02500 [Candidatus Cloacimonetes bacterium 4572_55]|nr:MAG: hypothetical protein B6244_02500 [Candidatus Cloacimonetes bacterium 4572_55]